MPELRDGPPWAMEEMILAEPGLVGADPRRRRRRAEAAESIREGGPVVIDRLRHERARRDGRRGAARRARARDAFEAALDPQDGGVLIAVSHEGGTAATLAALDGRRRRPHDPDHRQPDATPARPRRSRTPLRDTSWCHTVGYVSPLLAFTAIAGAADAATCTRVIDETLAQRARFVDAAQHARRRASA